MTKDLTKGEGNRAADRRYREGVRETVENTTPEERAERARNLEGEALEEAREAEKRTKARPSK